MKESVKEQPQAMENIPEEGNDFKPAYFKFPWELDARLNRYIADLQREERRSVSRNEVVLRVLDEFLEREGY